MSYSAWIIPSSSSLSFGYVVASTTLRRACPQQAANVKRSSLWITTLRFPEKQSPCTVQRLLRKKSSGPSRCRDTRKSKML